MRWQVIAAALAATLQEHVQNSFEALEDQSDERRGLPMPHEVGAHNQSPYFATPVVGTIYPRCNNYKAVITKG